MGSLLGILTGALLGLQIGTLEVGILAGVFGFLLWSQRESGERVVWMSSGVMLMLFSYWAFLLTSIYAVIGMLLFLAPLFLSKDIQDPPLEWTDGRWQQRVVLWVPLAVGPVSSA